uniref:FerB domain-containing protein n=1 Tax=Macrostomum lignano TaxID=282301 RepID=A0A1I8F1Y4_9PLAT
NVAGMREDFLLVGIIYEAGAMDEEIGSKGKPVSFELSIGTYGYDPGGKTNEALLEDEEDTGSTVKKSAPMWCHSVSPGRAPRLTRDEYYHVPFNERKPCLYMRCCYEDHRPRLFVSNILEKLCCQFEQDIEDVQELVSRERRGVLSRAASFAEALDTAAADLRACKGTGGRTLLDMQRQRQLRLMLEKMKVKLKAMRSQLTTDSVPVRLKECRALARLLRDSLLDQQHSLPDVFVWLLCEGQRLAFARVPARQILHSATSEAERGKDCGRVCQLKMYLWLGLLKDMRNYRGTVPEGYQATTFKYRRPPNEIVYTERSLFEFRAYLFMARNLIGSDESGLSDAFARVIVNDQIATTHVISESLSPMWDRTLAVNPVIFYFNEQTAIKMPFDKPEFLGRCFCKPMVTLATSALREPYRPPRLDWWEIYRGQLNAGELLAAFELIQLDPATGQTPAFAPSLEDLRRAPIPVEEQDDGGDGDSADGGRKPDWIPVPASIRPRLARYRIEILFWGVRELAKVQFQSVESPKVTVEFGGASWSATSSTAAERSRTFLTASSSRSSKSLLPENKWYWPPLMFQCEDNRQFGRTVLVGNHVISSVTKYIKREETEKTVVSDTQSVASTTKTGTSHKKKLFKFSSLSKSVLFSSKSSSSAKSGYENPAFETAAAASGPGFRLVPSPPVVAALAARRGPQANGVGVEVPSAVSWRPPDGPPCCRVRHAIAGGAASRARRRRYNRDVVGSPSADATPVHDTHPLMTVREETIAETQIAGGKAPGTVREAQQGMD